MAKRSKKAPAGRKRQGQAIMVCRFFFSLPQRWSLMAAVGLRRSSTSIMPSLPRLARRHPVLFRYAHRLGARISSAKIAHPVKQQSLSKRHISRENVIWNKSAQVVGAAWRARAVLPGTRGRSDLVAQDAACAGITGRHCPSFRVTPRPRVRLGLQCGSHTPRKGSTVRDRPSP